MGEFDRVSYDGKSIEDYLLDEKTKEIVATMDDKYYVKKKGRVKHMDAKEKHGAVEHTPQSEINALNLSNNITTSKTRADKVIMRLLAGQRLTSHAVVKYMGLRASDAASLLRLVWKSGLEPFCMREGTGGKGYFYSFKPAGLELKPAQAIHFFKTIGEERSTPQPTLEKEKKEKEKPVLTPPVVEQDHNINIHVNVTFSFKWGE